MSYSSFASFYDELTKNVDYKKRADYIGEILAKFNIKDGLLLDLACGTGSLSVEFSKMGFEVIATDASPDMLMEAGNKAMEENENILFLCQKMQETDLYGTVRAIVCSLDSINHLENAGELRKTFQVLKNFIDDGGIMVFDVNTVYKHRNILGNNTFVYDEKDVYCVWQNSLCSDGVTVGINLDFFAKEKNGLYNRYTENFKEIAFTDEEITEAVESAGFKIVEKYAELGFNKPEEDTQRIYYVVRREYNG
ncbi:MAG: class I SAM-dependent DNA methyltransferase [Acutalibacteraceae bacterium]